MYFYTDTIQRRKLVNDTVEPLITHTPRWSPKCMGFQGLWVWRGMLKIDSKKSPKNPKKSGKKLGIIFKDHNSRFVKISI